MASHLSSRKNCGMWVHYTIFILNSREEVLTIRVIARRKNELFWVKTVK